MTDCLLHLELVRWEAKPEAERSPYASTHLRTCDRCAAALAELASARQELLGTDPQAQSLAAARAILASVAERRRRAWWRLVVPLTLSPVAVAAVVLLVMSRGAFSPPPLAPSQSTGAARHVAGAVRAKGALLVEAFCKRGENVFPVKDGDDFVVGDRLRFAYTKDQPGMLLVFGVDDAGRLFPYYRDDVLTGVSAPPGSEVMLPESVELDDHHGWERVFALWTPASVGEDVVRTAVAEALAAVGGDIRQAARLPVQAEQVSFLLRRP
ncbi:MAG: hypothetical protein ABSF35_12995 [Polyangia bacterium]|jgi:hypothetical protein